MQRMPALLNLGRAFAARSSRARTSASMTPGQEGLGRVVDRPSRTHVGNLQIMVRTLRPDPRG